MQSWSLSRSWMLVIVNYWLFSVSFPEYVSNSWQQLAQTQAVMTLLILSKLPKAFSMLEGFRMPKLWN